VDARDTLKPTAGTGEAVYEQVLVPTDGSDAAMAAAEHAVAAARSDDATLHTLYVVDVRMSPVTTGMDREAVLGLLDRSEHPTAPILARAEDAGVSVVEAVRLGVPHEAIRAYVDEHDVDLVVMGTHGRTGVEHALLGSVTERVLRGVDVPVMTVREGTADDPMTDDGG
jgi:nucleotide-binding universal stress UspA family protein